MCDAAGCDEPIVHTKTRVAIFGHRAWTSLERIGRC